MGAVGGYIGYNYKTWENNLLIKVNEKRALRGMPEMNRQNLTTQIIPIGDKS